MARTEWKNDDGSSYDDTVVPDLEASPRVRPLEEMGVTGLKRAAGVLDEEFLPALRGRKAIKVFQEMSLNDPTVGSLLFAIEHLLKQTTWRTEGASNSAEDQRAAEFLESCMNDMSHDWGSMITEILSMLVYGWSWHEITYKRRMGPWEKDPKKKSQYTDGLIGWRKIAIRSQETLQRWIFDDEGGVKAMVQLAPPHYKTTVIPIEKSLLFRPKEYKGSPEGHSLLRNAYRPWFFKKRLEEFEAIGVERDLAGMPVAKIPAQYMNAAPGTADHKTFLAFKKLVSGVRRDEHEGLVLPNQYDRETKQPLFEFELMSSGGARQFDTNALIQRYEQRILMTVLADFIMIGHQGTGSYALHVDKTGIFRAALNAIAQSIADVFNRHAIPRLFEINGWKPNELPKIVADNVDAPDLTQLSSFMSTMGGLGMEWFPDPDLEKFLRKVAGLPDLPDEKIEMRREMAEQQEMLTYAQSQMEVLGMQQKAEMTAQGLSPEQAEMAAQAPTPEIQAQQEVAQYEGSALAEQQSPAVAQGHQAEQEQMAAQEEQQLIQGEQQEAREERKFERDTAREDLKEQREESKFQRDMQREQLRAQTTPGGQEPNFTGTTGDRAEPQSQRGARLSGAERVRLAQQGQSPAQQPSGRLSGAERVRLFLQQQGQGEESSPAREAARRKIEQWKQQR